MHALLLFIILNIILLCLTLSWFTILILLQINMSNNNNYNNNNTAHLFQRLSVALQRFNAVCVLGCFGGKQDDVD